MWRFALPGGSLRKQHVSFLVALATFTNLQPILTLADVAVQKETPDTKGKKCFFYGCPLLPRDVHYDTEVREALETIRTQKRVNLSDVSSSDSKSEESAQDALNLLESSGNTDSATLTLIGYKGGEMSSQVNQDRAFVVTPYHIRPKTDIECEERTNDPDSLRERQLLGVFDGHAKLGEHVSQFTVTNLPQLLSSKLDLAFENVKSKEEEEIVTKLALAETFVEMDKTVPAEISGGCTATVILQLDTKLYIANAGDSASFIVVYRKSTRSTEVVYISREDKPELPGERARVEAAGGEVYIPARIGATSRVIYTDPVTGNQNGLAMSRSIGDWEAGKVGVIPNPIVDVVDIPKLVSDRLASVSLCISNDFDDMILDACSREENIDEGEDDIEIFVVSATDGMMDYVSAETIAEALAASLYEDDGSHPLSACENLVSLAASGWYHAKQGRYRDDIAIAVSKIKIPKKE